MAKLRFSYDSDTHLTHTIVNDLHYVNKEIFSKLHPGLKTFSDLMLLERKKLVKIFYFKI